MTLELMQLIGSIVTYLYLKLPSPNYNSTKTFFVSGWLPTYDDDDDDDISSYFEIERAAYLLKNLPTFSSSTKTKQSNFLLPMRVNKA